MIAGEHGPTRDDAPTVTVTVDTLRALIEGAEYMAVFSDTEERGGRCSAYLHRAANRARAALPEHVAWTHPADSRGH